MIGKSVSIQIFTALLLLLNLSSCKEEDMGDIEEISGLGGDTWVKGTIDKWLMDSLTAPYNIAVQYKWDQFQYGDVSKNVVPIKEEVVIPFSRTVRNAWIKPYVDQAGLNFFNRYSPKLFVLAGSGIYFDNGGINLGQAEGGRKIVVLDLNNFRVKGMPGYVAAKDSNNVKEGVLTLHHEFGHILHANILYPPEFRTVSAGLFQGENWINLTNAEARHDGFITNYASSGYNDDFVETISYLLVEGKDGYTRILNSIPEGVSVNGTSKAEAQAKLRRKEALIVNYFKSAWGIDFYSLQTRCRAAVVKLI